MSQKIISLLGIFVFMGIAYLCSSNRKAINYRTVLVALLTSFLIAVPVFLLPISRDFLLWFSEAFDKLIDAAREGPKFVLGYLGVQDDKNGFVFLFQAMPLIIVFSALFGILYYVGIMTFIISKIASLSRKLFGISVMESIYSACSLFVGTESFLSIRPYLNKLTKSQIFLMFTCFMSTVASSTLALYVSVLSAKFPTIAGHLVSASIISLPAAVIIAKIMEPETEDVEDFNIKVEKPESYKTFNGTIVACATDGGKMICNICMMLIAIIGLIGIANMLINYICPITLTQILGYAFVPFTFFLGVDPSDILKISELLGIRTILTEIPSYIGLGEFVKVGAISDRSAMIASYALCGFANVGSIGIALGSINSLVPEKLSVASKIAYKSLFSAFLATLITGCIAGVFYN
ncbi:MAG: hypothetical protein MJ247_05630 [Alphaproteobacteria bacterium]|nr:hypothetical protein [Alphaproteobacteria bacterium]